MSQVKAQNLIRGFMTLLFLGLAMILIGVLLLVLAMAFSGSQAGVGGFILIGPFPILFGTGPEAPWLVLLAITLGLISIILFYLASKEVLK